MLKPIIFLSFILLAYQQSQASYYIWLNYGQIQTSRYDQTNLRIKLPCQSRIQQCSFNYHQIPPGWRVLQNGDLILPQNDLKGLKSYSIEVTLSQPTGQVIEASLIADIQDQKIKIVERQSFFDSFSYRPNLSSLLNSRKPVNSPSSAPTNSRLTINNNNQIKQQEKSSMDIPKVNQIVQVLKNGQADQISSILIKVINSDIECKDKVKYLEEVVREVRIQRIRNEGKLQIHRNQIQILQGQLQKLKHQKKLLLQRMQEDVGTLQFKSKMQQLQNKKNQAQNRQKKNQKIAENYLRAIKQSTRNKVITEETAASLKPNNTVSDELILKMDQQELVLVNNAIKQLIDRKTELEKQIIQKRYQQQTSKLKQLPNNIQSLENNYREYTNLAVKAKIQYEKYIRQIESERKKLQTSQKSQKLINEAIQKIKEQIQSKQNLRDGSSVQSLQNLIQILKNNSEKIKGSISELEQGCPNRI